MILSKLPYNLLFYHTFNWFCVASYLILSILSLFWLHPATTPYFYPSSTILAPWFCPCFGLFLSTVPRFPAFTTFVMYCLILLLPWFCNAYSLVLSCRLLLGLASIFLNSTALLSALLPHSLILFECSYILEVSRSVKPGMEVLIG